MHAAGGRNRRRWRARAAKYVRVTSVYERLKGQWRVVHRHADPITNPRPAESVLGQ